MTAAWGVLTSVASGLPFTNSRWIFWTTVICCCARIRAESLPKSERAALQREDYVMGVDGAVPAIISLNAVIAGLGVTAVVCPTPIYLANTNMLSKTLYPQISTRRFSISGFGSRLRGTLKGTLDLDLVELAGRSGATEDA
jgi:hypothetical protein